MWVITLVHQPGVVSNLVLLFAPVGTQKCGGQDTLNSLGGNEGKEASQYLQNHLLPGVVSSLSKAKSTSKLSRLKNHMWGWESLSPHTTQVQQLSQRFPEALVTISAASFTFLALSQPSFGPWAPPVPIPALARGVQARPGPSRAAAPPGQHRQRTQHVSGLVGCSPEHKWLPAHPPVPSCHLPEFRGACRHQPT